ncbi:T9SS type A sorting domain-containing protein, partial [Arthrospira platensis SPKY1]|nr:T9SS type A sorting domain-containing protein [Arthrospira platensis SPKY1]
AIFRRNANNLVAAGAGKVGLFSIVMEDIIVGLTTLETDLIRMVDNQLNSTKIAPSSTALAEDPALHDSAEGLTEELLRLYPNPTNAWLTLELQAAPDTYIQKVDVHTMSGQQLAGLTAARPAPTVMIDLGTLPDGMYLLKIETNRGIILRKAVKMPR